MTGGQQETARRIGTAALSGLTGIAVRAVALLPAVLTAKQGGPAGPLLSLALYALLVIPHRFWCGERMRLSYSVRPAPTGVPYFLWLKTGLIRHGRGYAWGLPLMAAAAYFVIGYSTLTVTDMWRPVQNLPTLLGMEPALQTGVIMTGAILLVLGAVFAWGWARDWPVEYLPVRDLGPMAAVRASARMRKKHRRALSKTTAVNALLWLPGAAALGAVILGWLRGKLDFSGSMALMSSITKLTEEPMPAETAAALAAVFFLIYVPLCLWRKMRNARAIQALLEEDDRRAAG